MVRPPVKIKIRDSALKYLFRPGQWINVHSKIGI